MKKMIFVLTALLLAAPALANVTISCDASAGVDVDINYTATEDGNLPRGLGLEITVDNGATIDSISNVNADYWVHPGSIVIDTNDPASVVDQGTPVASGLGTGSVILEMGSLHYPPEVNSVNAPALSGTLLTITVSGDCNVAIAGNAERGNVVNYAAAAADTVYTGCTVQTVVECYAGQPDYAEWVAAGKPECWCYPRQCHGDADGLKEGGSKTGYWYVGNGDLNIMAPAWNVKEPPQGPGLSGNMACADFDHVKEGGSKTGYWRVGNGDLNAMAAYWNVKEPPQGTGTPADCPPGNRTP